MRVLGLDIGTRRVGVAVSDELGMTAQPLETVHIGRGESAVPRIAALCAELGVERIVAGVPFELDGRAGKMVRVVRRVLEQVATALGVPKQLRGDAPPTAVRIPAPGELEMMDESLPT